MNIYGKLFRQFPSVSSEEWMDQIRADLKGGDFHKKAVWKYDEGFDILPFYRREDIENLKFINSTPGEFPYVRGAHISNKKWRVRQNIDVVDYKAANRKAIDILNKGVDSLGFVITDPESVSAGNISLLLKDIIPEAVEINFLSNGKASEIVSFFIEHIRKSGTDPGLVSGAIETDPLGRLMLNGTLCVPVEKGFDYLAGVAATTASLPRFRAIHLNASSFRNAGAGAVFELAAAMSMGAEYMAQLTDRGISPAMAASKIRFSFGAGPDYFPEIAKLRAARMTWSAVIGEFCPGDTEAAVMDIHTVTARWNKTIYDPYVNILRTQTEAMSSILGGTDSLTVEPFDIVFRKGDAFSERIARNQQLILKEEAGFDKVTDAPAGSYYIENLTYKMAGAAWNLFLELEDEGGFLESLKKGLIQAKIMASATKRKSDISRRKTMLLGTSLYPDPSEKAREGLTNDALSAMAPLGEKFEIQPLMLFRGAEIFEKLRFDVENSSHQPLVFLLTIGDRTMRRARAQFASDFFGCAGYAIKDNPGFDTVEEGIEAYLKAKADIIVVCSSDEEYSTFAPEILKHAEGKALVVVAGNPACTEELKQKGLGYFISLSSDVAETLSHFNEKLGITRNDIKG